MSLLGLVRGDLVKVVHVGRSHDVEDELELVCIVPTGEEGFAIDYKGSARHREAYDSRGR